MECVMIIILVRSNFKFTVKQVLFPKLWPVHTMKASAKAKKIKERVKMTKE